MFKSLLPCIIIMSLITTWAYTGTITVNSNDDNNSRDTVITLREAIMLSEESLAYGDLTVDEQAQVIPPVGSGIADTIDFSISDTISPTLALPGITDDGTVIDASSQWIGAWPEGQPGITLDGSGIGGVEAVGLVVYDADNCQIRGLLIKIFENSGVVIRNGSQLNAIGGTGEGYRNVISGNGLGVYITGSGTNNNVVSGNYIGADVNGTVDFGNSDTGVRIDWGAQSNTIGGTTEGERNIISGNGTGVSFWESNTNNNKVSGNYIGTDVTGTVNLGNDGRGVTINNGCQFNIIGGITAGERNIISGNVNDGVGIDGTNNVVSGNYIGTDITGTVDLGNAWDGVSITPGAQSNIIGGITPGERNIISGNNRNGVSIGGSTNNILGNYIGTDVTGKADLGNSWDGVFIASESNIIGGATEGTRNIISGNGHYGVHIGNTGTDNNVISGNYIGVDVTGEADLGNLWGGGLIANGAQSNIIGGTTDVERNIISGNDGHGVQLADTGTNNNVISGNYIGTNVDGTVALGNSEGGIGIYGGAQSSTIGGGKEGERNIISGNGWEGVAIGGTGTDNNVVSGNYIGTDVNGTNDLGNSLPGVGIGSGAQSNIIGGTTEAEKNLISGNGAGGVSISNAGTDNNVVSGNYIGTDVTGIVALGNSQSGVLIYDGAQSNIVGETGNIIAFNNWNGVKVRDTNTDYNKIPGNSIHDNGNSGIELADGGNDEIPAPTITSGNLVDNTLIISGNGAGTNATVEIFKADSFDSGEGKTSLGSLVADGSGNFSGLIDVTGLAVGDPLVATTTHTDNNTSEFSVPPVPVEGPPPMPQVIEEWPNPGATVKRETNIYAVFSKPMDESTLTSSTVIVEGTKSGVVTGSITFESGIERVVFSPDVPFAPNEQVTVTLTGDIKDIDGNGLDGDRDGVSEGSPEDDFRWEFSTIPHALSLDGDGDYVEVPDSDSLDITEQITIEFWVLIREFDDEWAHFLIKPWEPFAGPWVAYEIVRNGNTRGVKFSISIGEQHIGLLSPTDLLELNKWLHLAGVYDGNNMFLYANGELIAEQPVTGLIDTTDTSLTIGGLKPMKDVYDVNSVMDDVRIWNIARTQREIQTTMKTTLKGDEPGLVGYWNFDDGTAIDSSPYGNHGTLMRDAQIIPLFGTWPPRKTGDVSGDNTISAYDAALILKYVVGLMDDFPADSMVSPSAISPRPYIVKIPEFNARAGDRIHVPIAIDDAAGLLAGGVTLKYNSTILKAIDVAALGMLSGSYWKGNAELDGEVRFAFATIEPAKGQGNLLMVEFKVLPHTEGKTSPLIIDKVNLSNSLNITKINGSVTVIPSTFALLQNYPNPFNPETWIPFKIAKDASVTINIYNAKGQLIRTIALGQKAAGVYLSKDKAAYWNGKDNIGEKVSSGVYYYTLRSDKFIATRKLVVVK